MPFEFGHVKQRRRLAAGNGPSTVEFQHHQLAGGLVDRSVEQREDLREILVYLNRHAPHRSLLHLAIV